MNENIKQEKSDIFVIINILENIYIIRWNIGLKKYINNEITRFQITK